MSREKILGVCGQAGAGKDAVADILVKHCGFVRVALADPLKRICRDVFQFTDEQLWGPSAKRNEPDKRYPRVGFKEYPRMSAQDAADIVGPGTEAYLTPRHALQQLGTEWGRACYPDIWVEYAMRMACYLLKGIPLAKRRGSAFFFDYSAHDGLVPPLGSTDWNAYASIPPKGVVISDVRFKNEVDSIKKAGGKVIRVVRPGAGLAGQAGEHRSETEQSSMEDSLFDCIVDNSGTLQELEHLVLSFEGYGFSNEPR